MYDNEYIHFYLRGFIDKLLIIQKRSGAFYMLEEKIEKLREKLHLLIAEDANYNDVLKVSRELDYYIIEYLRNENEKSTIIKE